MISTPDIFRTLLVCTVLSTSAYLIVIVFEFASNSNFETVREEEFNIFRGLVDDGTVPLPVNSSDTCPELPSSLLGSSRVSLAVPSERNIVQTNPNVKQGGWFQPEDCRARHKVAIIIPCRNRSDHLHILLNNLHPFLQRQRLEYVIFVVEQAGELVFNKGKLLNVASIEASKLLNFDCFVFHDTDLIPENDHNLYSCSSQPTLLAVAISSFQYKPMYENHFGGVVSITKDHFTAANGYSNLYWGWGKEDDDLSERVRHRFGSISRRHRAIGRYTMIRHDTDTLNPKNVFAYYLSKAALGRATEDGLNNLRYEVVRTETRALYTWILVDIGRPPAVVRLSDGIGFVDNERLFPLDRCTWNANGSVMCQA